MIKFPSSDIKQSESKFSVINKSINSIKLGWLDFNAGGDKVRPDEKYYYVLQMYSIENGWKTIYWGYKTEYEIKNLSSRTCYKFRLSHRPPLSKTPDQKIDKKSFVWSEIYRVATLNELPHTDDLNNAIQSSKTQKIRKIIQLNPKLVEIPNYKMVIPLVSAVQNGDNLVVSLLLSAGADVNGVCEISKRSGLMVAMFDGNLGIATLLIDRGASWDQEDRNGMNAMHYAVDGNVKKAVIFALKHGANPNKTDNKKWSALFRAVILACNLEIIKVLVPLCNLEDKDSLGLTCEDHCRISNRTDIFQLVKIPEKIPPENPIKVLPEKTETVGDTDTSNILENLLSPYAG